MDHIERGFCTRIDTAVLDELREKKLEFTRNLEQLTQESIKGNYMKYMPSAIAKNSISGWHVDKEPTSFEMVQEEFPDLSTTTGDRTQHTKVTMSNKSKPTNSNADDKNATQHLFQLPFRPAIKTETTPVPSIKNKEEARGSIQLPLRLLVNSNRGNKNETPTPVQLPRPAFKPGVTTILAGMDPDDPNSPSFNAARYYCSITEKFNCPKRLCG